MSVQSQSTKLAPTVEAIDAWLALQEANKPPGARFANEYDQYGVDVRTKAGSWRNVTMRQHGMGIVNGVDAPGYWTIRGEGSSNGGRETWISAPHIVQARGWRIFDDNR
jgi:hypothetical protein